MTHSYNETTPKLIPKMSTYPGKKKKLELDLSQRENNTKQPIQYFVLWHCLD